MKHSKASKTSIALARYMGILFFLGFAYIVQKRVSNPLTYWVIFLIASIIWFLYYPKSHKKSLAKQTLKMITEDENKGFLGSQTLEMDDESITVTNEHSCKKMKWSLFNKIICTDEYIYIYDSSVSAVIIPASAFENIDDMNSFYKNVEEKLT